MPVIGIESSPAYQANPIQQLAMSSVHSFCEQPSLATGQDVYQRLSHQPSLSTKMFVNADKQLQAL